MIKITIEKITEYDEFVNRWRDPNNPEKVYESKYELPSEVVPVSFKHATGEKRQQNKLIYEQIVDPTIDNEKNILENVVKAVNVLS